MHNIQLGFPSHCDENFFDFFLQLYHQNMNLLLYFLFFRVYLRPQQHLTHTLNPCSLIVSFASFQGLQRNLKVKPITHSIRIPKTASAFSFMKTEVMVPSQTLLNISHIRQKSLFAQNLNTLQSYSETSIPEFTFDNKTFLMKWP